MCVESIPNILGVISSIERLDGSNGQEMGVGLAPFTIIFKYHWWNLCYLDNLNFCLIRDSSSFGRMASLEDRIKIHWFYMPADQEAKNEMTKKMVVIGLICRES